MDSLIWRESSILVKEVKCEGLPGIIGGRLLQAKQQGVFSDARTPTQVTSNYRGQIDSHRGMAQVMLEDS